MTDLNDSLALGCGQVLPNRLMKAAMSEVMASRENAPDDRLPRLYRTWGAGGYGLVITGNVMIDRDHIGEPGNVVVDDDRDLDVLQRWAKATQDGGSKIWMQLNHPGRQANPMASRTRPVAPSATGLAFAGLPSPRALHDDEIESIVESFAVTVQIAEAAGFDGVQVHGAHGYLVSQFLSPLSNERTDRWGGDIDGRSRFLVAVVRAIRAAVNPGFAVGVKLNSADFQRGGFTADESQRVLRILSDEAIDLIEISGGNYESQAFVGRPAVADSTAAREAYFLDYARAARGAAGDIPLAVTGGFRTLSAMSEAVTNGDCDVVGVARPAALAPTSARDVLDGRLTVLPNAAVALLPDRLTTHAQFKALAGLVDLQWHTDQLHRLGAGKAPDLRRSPWRTLGSMVRRNGLDALRRRRSSGARATS